MESLCWKWREEFLGSWGLDSRYCRATGFCGVAQICKPRDAHDGKFHAALPLNKELLLDSQAMAMHVAHVVDLGFFTTADEAAHNRDCAAIGLNPRVPKSFLWRKYTVLQIVETILCVTKLSKRNWNIITADMLRNSVDEAKNSMFCQQSCIVDPEMERQAREMVEAHIQEHSAGTGLPRLRSPPPRSSAGTLSPPAVSTPPIDAPSATEAQPSRRGRFPNKTQNMEDGAPLTRRPSNPAAMVTSSPHTQAHSKASEEGGPQGGQEGAGGIQLRKKSGRAQNAGNQSVGLRRRQGATKFSTRTTLSSLACGHQEQLPPLYQDQQRQRSRQAPHEAQEEQQPPKKKRNMAGAAGESSQHQETSRAHSSSQEQTAALQALLVAAHQENGRGKQQIRALEGHLTDAQHKASQAHSSSQKQTATVQALLVAAHQEDGRGKQRIHALQASLAATQQEASRARSSSQDQIAALQASLAAAQKDASQGQHKICALQAFFAATVREISKANSGKQEQIATLQASLNTMQQDAARGEEKVTALQAALDATQQEASRAHRSSQEQIAALKASFVGAQEDADRGKEQITTLQASRAAAEQKDSQGQEKITALQAALDATQQEASRVHSSSQEQIAALRDSLSAAKEQANTAEQHASRAEEQAAAKEKQLQAAQNLLREVLDFRQGAASQAQTAGPPNLQGVDQQQGQQQAQQQQQPQQQQRICFTMANWRMAYDQMETDEEGVPGQQLPQPPPPDFWRPREQLQQWALQAPPSCQRQ